MASKNIITLFVLFFSGFIVQGYCECEGFPLQISQSQTGKTVENKAEWKVTVTNPCACNQLNVKFGCDGFSTVENIDPEVLSKSGGECLINNGEPIGVSGDSFSFTYAWDTKFPFTIASSTPSCSS